jgi:hypothetical protein
MEVPDIVGYTVPEALAMLKSNGVSIETITVTSPPREKETEYKEFFRVIRVKNVEYLKVKLLVCRPLNYEG